MKTQAWHNVMDKSGWGEGPWNDEPDKMQWQDEATGLPCLIVRNQVGALCGYVGVDRAHPLYGVSYSQTSEKLRATLEARKDQPLKTEEIGMSVMLAAIFGGGLEPTPENALAVHGGITFSNKCHPRDAEGEGICHVPDKGEPEDVWWFGFDCVHAGDMSPGVWKIASKEYRRTFRSDVYRSVPYVMEQCKKLAAQLDLLDLPEA